MANKIFTDESLATLVDETKSYVDGAVSGKSDSGHTHNYAGSSSSGGAATSANKLNTSAGSTTQPVYFENGVPKATSYSLSKSVPSDAKFTDTVYTLPEAGSSLGGVKSGGDVTISGGLITVNDDSHNHTISNVDNLQTTLDSKAPTSHASTATTYGIGTGSNYGHVKLSDSTTSDSGTSAGIAATPAAVKAVNDLVSGKANSSHNHSGSEITSGTVAAARLPLASDSASGIVNTDTQSFKGSKTFTSSITVAGLKPSTANAIDIGTSSMPFDGVFAKDLCIAPQVSGGSAIQAGRFTVDRVGTTTANGLARLEIGNYIQSGKAGNAEGYLEIYNKANGSVTLRTSHEDDNNFFVELPEHSGTLLTDDDVYTKSQSYSKTELDWTQIYDSGSITNAVNSIYNINISGYKKIMVAVKCVNNANSAARAGSAILKSSTGTIYQFPVWTNLFTTSAATSAGMAEFDIVNGYIICPYASRSINVSNFLNPTDGGTADNLANTGGGILKCANWNDITSLTVSSLDQNASYYFKAGSRVIVWGCKA